MQFPHSASLWRYSGAGFTALSPASLSEISAKLIVRRGIWNSCRKSKPSSKCHFKMIKKIIEHRVFKNAVALMIIQMTQYVVPFLTLALLTRRLGVDSYSLLAFVMTIIQFANVVTDYGFYLSATEKLSRNRSWKNLVNHLIGSVIICKIFLYLVVSCVIIGFAFLSDQFESHKYIIILAVAPVLANTFLPTWFFQGMEKMKSIIGLQWHLNLASF